MMFTITVELLDGAVTAGAPDDIALTGAEDPGEWPLSPARLFAALVAADGTGDRMKLTDGSELRALEEADPPSIIADSRNDVAVAQRVPRYVPADARAGGSVQEYIGRKATLVRGAPQLFPKTPVLTYVWPDLELTQRQSNGLRIRAARVGYLGRATSSVRVRIHDQLCESELDQDPLWEPYSAGTTSLPVPFTGLVDVLDRMYRDFAEGVPARRSWYRNERIAYRDPARAHEAVDTPPAQIIWLRLHGSLSGRHALLATEALRGAVLSAYEEHIGGSPDAVPAVLHGHTSGAAYDHASWLALPHVGHKNATGRIHGLAVMLPSDTPGETVEGVRTAIRAITELRMPGESGMEISLHAGARRPFAATPQRWQGPATIWQSVFPVVHERFVRPKPGLEEIGRWCKHAGFPTPIAARISRVPLLNGAVSLMPHEARRNDSERRPYSHLEVTFAEPVRGPLVLGHLRHFGLGLMAPAPNEASNSGAGSDG